MKPNGCATLKVKAAFIGSKPGIDLGCTHPITHHQDNILWMGFPFLSPAVK
jgi:hypothetical protein